MKDDKEVQKKYDYNSLMYKNPFLGNTSNRNLIELFLIIGYEEEVRNKEIYKEIEDIVLGRITPIDQPKGPNDNTFFLIYSGAPQPSLINSVSGNDASTVMLDNDCIMKLVFPSPPPVYYLLDSKKFEPNQYSVIFLMNSDAVDSLGNKQTYQGYSFIFYEKKEEKIEIKGNPEAKILRVYIPKAFCIISKCPYFHQFYILCKTIHDLMEYDSEVDIPLEILIYNIVNYIPAPINNHMNISFFPVEMTPQKKAVTEKDPPNFLCLTGYPIFDFNLNEIFNILEPEKIAEILLFNFLEIDMIFFSKNIEVLNLMMYIIALLNYPCNDTSYQWHLVSVSKAEVDNDSSKFINKPMTTMVGINCSYEKQKIEQFHKGHFIVDLDKKELSFCFFEDEDQDQNNDLAKLYYWVHDVINDKIPTKCDLDKNIKKLISELEPISRKVLHANNSHNGDKKQIIPKFLTSEVNAQTNKKTQEVFYSFILNLIKCSYQRYEILNAGAPSQTNKLIRTKKDIGIAEEEIFLDLFELCSKFSTFMVSFMHHHQIYNSYSISSIFSEEFLQMNKDIEEEYENAQHFATMDKFFHQDKMDTFTCNLKEKTEIFNFKEFYTYYNEELKEKMFSDIQESMVINAVRKKTHKGKMVYQYKKIELDNNVLHKYIYHLNSLSDEKIIKILPSSQRVKIAPVKQIKYSDIIQSIEFTCLSNKTLNMNNLIEFSFIIYYSLTISLMTEEEFHQQFQIVFQFMEKQTYFLRKYMIVILTVYLCHAKNLIAQKKKYDYILYGYCLLLNMALNKRLLMNQDLDLLFKEFSLLCENQNDYNEKLDKSNIKEEELTEVPLIKTYTINDDNQSDLKKRNEERNNYSISLRKNFCFDGFKKEDYIMRIAENILYEGDITLKNSKDQNIIKPKLKFAKKGYEFNNEYDIYSPLKIYNLCNQMLNKYLLENTLSNIDNETLLVLLINLLFYQLNSKSLEIKIPMLFLSHFLKKK